MARVMIVSHDGDVPDSVCEAEQVPMVPCSIYFGTLSGELIPDTSIQFREGKFIGSAMSQSEHITRYFPFGREVNEDEFRKAIQDAAEAAGDVPYTEFAPDGPILES